MSSNSAPGTLFIVSAPSGGGKTSLICALLKKLPYIKVSISHTTRLPRQGELNGKNYFFVTETEFKHLEAKGNFLEHAKVFNHFYGTSKAWVGEQLRDGTDVVLDIDWQGARSIKSQMDCVTIFILPPSKEILLTRLQGRQQDSAEVITQRMAQASQEIAHYKEYDFVIINDDFESSLADLTAIVRAQRLKTAAQQQRYAQQIAALMASEA